MARRHAGSGRRRWQGAGGEKDLFKGVSCAVPAGQGVEQCYTTWAECGASRAVTDIVAIEGS